MSKVYLIHLNVNICKCGFVFSICSDYEAIKQRAIAKPASTAELNDIIKYIDNAKGDKSIQLTRRIKVCLNLFDRNVFICLI
jgi:hypothetical protein